MNKWAHHFAGQIIHPFIVVCWSCHKQLLGPRYRSEAHFRKGLIDIGWIQVEEMWVCPQDAEEVTRTGIRKF
jgi:hypothetical protein